ncbi:hypothetical protein [Roseococcus sp. YIM B11640]|uniref:hypothetical protein n=1 Tax=Roseococcus sp. YIM B11640 TaxID=3133973 RepID=UPI003C7D3103
MKLPSDIGAALQRHRARLSPGSDGAFVLSDTTAAGWQVFELPNRDVARATVRLRFAIRPAAEGETSFSIHEAIGAEVARISREGEAQPVEGKATSLSVQDGGSGWLRVDLEYFNVAPSIVLGLGRPTSRFAGAGKPQFELKDLEVEVIKPRWTPSATDPLVIVQSGVNTLAEPAWLPFAEGLNVIAFGTGEGTAQKVLSDRNGTSSFLTTKVAGHGSILKPDGARLKAYPAAADFALTGEHKVETCRYDTLVKQGAAPAPDVIRLEAQGMEYNALRGFGDVLDKVLAVETQLYLYPVYRKQKLLGDIVDLLDSSGLVLRRAAPQHPRVSGRFGQELVKLTGIFMRRRAGVAQPSRYELLEEIWALPAAT